MRFRQVKQVGITQFETPQPCRSWCMNLAQMISKWDLLR